MSAMRAGAARTGTAPSPPPRARRPPPIFSCTPGSMINDHDAGNDGANHHQGGEPLEQPLHFASFHTQPAGGATAVRGGP